MPYEQEVKFYWKCERCGLESRRFIGNGDEEIWWVKDGWVMNLDSDEMLCNLCAAQHRVHADELPRSAKPAFLAGFLSRLLAWFSAIRR